MHLEKDKKPFSVGLYKITSHEVWKEDFAFTYQSLSRVGKRLSRERLDYTNKDRPTEII